MSSSIISTPISPKHDRWQRRHGNVHFHYIPTLALNLKNSLPPPVPASARQARD
jgi:hypothetical protein